jgi:hypothetical protein
MAQKEQTKTKMPPGRSEIVSEAIECLLAGSLYIALYLTLPLSFPINYLIIIVGAALLVIAPTLLILTYGDALLSKTERFLRWIKIPIFVAAILSIPIAMGQIINLLNDIKLNLWSTSYLIFMMLCMILIIIAEIIAIIRIYKH